MPDTVQLAVAFANADIAEPGLSVQAKAGGVLGHYLRLQRPVVRRFRLADQPLEQSHRDPVSVRNSGDIDADLSDTCGPSSIRHGRQRGPAGDSSV